MRFLIIYILLLSTAFTASAQDEKYKAINSQLIELNKKFEDATNKNIQFGLSLGYRLLTKKSRAEYQQASISPIDSTLQLTDISGKSFILSTSAIFNPRFNTEKITQKLNAEIFSFVIKDNIDKKFHELPIEDQLIISGLALYEGYTIDTTITISQYKNFDTVINSPGNKFAYLNSHSVVSKLIQKRNALSDTLKTEKKDIKRTIRTIRTLRIGKTLIDYFVDRITIMANLNLIEFSTAEKELSFNRAIDGGLGVAYEINPNLYLGVNWENLSVRQLQSYIKDLAGQVLKLNGEIITSSESLDINNNDIFINRNLSGISFKIVASF